MQNYWRFTCRSHGFPQDKNYSNDNKSNFYFPLSDHVDCVHLQQFIKECAPKNVFLFDGYINEFNYFLKNNDIFKVFPLINKKKQLNDFI